MRNVMKLSALCALCVLLSGCGNKSEDWTELFVKMKLECEGIVTYTVTRGNWNTELSMMCTEDQRDDH